MQHKPMKRRNLKLGEKFVVIDFWEAGNTTAQAARKYRICQRTARRIWNERTTLAGTENTGTPVEFARSFTNEIPCCRERCGSICAIYLFRTIACNAKFDSHMCADCRTNPQRIFIYGIAKIIQNLLEMILYPTLFQTARKRWNEFT